MVKGNELVQLRAREAEYLHAWQSRGKQVTTYNCPHCAERIVTTRPTEQDVGSNGRWSSMKVCVNCGKNNFVLVYPNGKCEVVESV